VTVDQEASPRHRQPGAWPSCLEPLPLPNTCEPGRPRLTQSGLRRRSHRALAQANGCVGSPRLRFGEGPISPKSRAGTRDVPIVAALRAHLAAHLLRERNRDGLIFGRTASEPFDPRTLAIRAGKAWTAARLTPIGLHELRHTCASLFIAAGVNAKALATYLGHSSITVTLDRYGHLFPGSEDEAVALVDAYLERATGAETGASEPQTAPLRAL
jgi:integrase